MEKVLFTITIRNIQWHTNKNFKTVFFRNLQYKPGKKMEQMCSEGELILPNKKKRVKATVIKIVWFCF